MQYRFFIFLLSLMFASVTWADGNIAVTKIMEIPAPAAAVWAKVGDFSAMNGWHPAVAKDEITEGENNKVGAIRVLTLGDGGTIQEELMEWDDAGMSMTYRILESVLPVSSYTATIKVLALDDKTSKITWSGSFDAKRGADDKTASTTISGIYDAGLENLRKIMSVEK